MIFFVFSDSHGIFLPVKQALERRRGSYDAVFFLGDGAGDLSPLSSVLGVTPLLAVRGNCDSLDADAPLERIVEFAGEKLFLCHGHRYGVKSGTDVLKTVSAAKGCRIALFGHTHQPLCRSDGGVLLCNPGSAASGSFGILELSSGAVRFDLHRLQYFQ